MRPVRYQPPGATPPVSAPARLRGREVDVDDRLLARLRSVCPDVSVDPADLTAGSRDWWPLAVHWAVTGTVAARPAAVARPRTSGEVAAVLAACHDARVPVTASAGRSGVCGGAVPLHGGVVLDLAALAGVVDVDRTSLVLDVRPGTFGDDLEQTLRADHGATLGHWPQSMAISTVGGWLACRSAGQLSTRYGKIEDMVVGLEVARADGRLVRTGGAPRAAVGPDLTQLFVGSEGTLGVITEAWLRLHPAPTAERRGAWGFSSFAAGLDACRRIRQRGATPAVLRLYDATEAARAHGVEDRHLLLVLDEGDPPLVDAVLQVVGEECAAAERLDDDLVEHWVAHRQDVPDLGTLADDGIVADTIEVAGRWSVLPALYEDVRAAVDAVPHTLVVSAHQSHAYTDGACLYFTFAGQPPQAEGPSGREAYYVAAWDAATRAVLAHGGALSHHHGVGLNRGRFVATALGPALAVLATVKAALDPHGILNPGKLGLPDPYGEVAWP
jgi:alkyldihydroxyacetonephosphate synthase